MAAAAAGAANAPCSGHARTSSARSTASHASSLSGGRGGRVVRSRPLDVVDSAASSSRCSDADARASCVRPAAGAGADEGIPRAWGR